MSYHVLAGKSDKGYPFNVLKNLNTSSMEELRRAAAAAQEKLNKLQPNTTAYKTTAADLEKIKSLITG